MDMQKIDWKVVTKWLIGFALGKAMYDYFTIGKIDFYGVIFIPIIALGLIYTVDKKQLMKEEK